MIPAFIRIVNIIAEIHCLILRKHVQFSQIKIIFKKNMQSISGQVWITLQQLRASAQLLITLRSFLKTFQKEIRSE